MLDMAVSRVTGRGKKGANIKNNAKGNAVQWSKAKADLQPGVCPRHRAG
jgi:hypothetical protein